MHPAAVLVGAALLLGAVRQGAANVVRKDAATQVLQHIVDRIVHRYELQEQERRVCGSENIRTPDHLLYRNGSSLWMEAPVCCPGYTRNATSLLCEPHCRTNCPNGRCVAPDTCACLRQFAESLAGQCVPTCPVSCLNGRCYGDECVCDPGHRAARRICVPLCEGDCAGGNCTAPNVCVCKAGYLPDETGRCKPYCRGGCVNATCTAPNTCTCKQGYKKQAGVGASPSVCVPDCEGRCVHGDCRGPGGCACHPGYEASSQRYVCAPRCLPRCVNATCTGPGVCTCKPGHVKKDGQARGHVCVPPANHTCGAGYREDSASGSCAPVCSRPCLHGTCSGPDTCSCLPGYDYDFYRQECRPACTPPCQNADCAAGNQCVCNPGYARDNTDWQQRRCVPLCDPYCVNGVCTSPNQCACNPGFRKHPSGYHNVCVPHHGRSLSDVTTTSYG